jgi:phage terminase large subunit GpA-like protein
MSARFLEGDTTDPDRGAFAALDALTREGFEDAFGHRRQVLGLAIDAGDGGRANQVYAFARRHHRVYAVKGVPGWNRPAIGAASTVSVNRQGKRVGSARLWPVGTWDLKAEFYANLRKDGRRAGQELDPPGYCHFGTFLDEGYFRQITSEYLADVKLRGRTSKVWRDSGPNHLLDCRVYAMAVAEHLGLTKNTREDWRALAAALGLTEDNRDLLAQPAMTVAPESASPPGGAQARPDVADELERAISGKPTRSSKARAGRFPRLGRARR